MADASLLQKTGFDEQPSLIAGAASDTNSEQGAGMVLPFEPLAMSFTHLWYSVDLPAGAEPDPEVTKNGGKARLYLLKVRQPLPLNPVAVIDRCNCIGSIGLSGGDGGSWATSRHAQVVVAILSTPRYQLELHGST